MFNFGNRIDYAKKGWIVDQETIGCDYRSHYKGWQCGESLAWAWVSGTAHNASGDLAVIWWHILPSRRDVPEFEQLVGNWAKCNDIEIIDVNDEEED